MFEVFKRPRASQRPLLVTVQENGALRLNAAAYRAIDQPTYVLLLHDPETEAVAVRPCGQSSGVTFRAGGSGLISCAEFIRHTGLTLGRYPARVDGDLLVVDRG
jgi:hypothetical protein